jgi:hypothetical protein
MHNKVQACCPVVVIFLPATTEHRRSYLATAIHECLSTCRKMVSNILATCWDQTARGNDHANASQPCPRLLCSFCARTLGPPTTHTVVSRVSKATGKLLRTSREHPGMRLKLVWITSGHGGCVWLCYRPFLSHCNGEIYGNSHQSVSLGLQESCQGCPIYV